MLEPIDFIRLVKRSPSVVPSEVQDHLEDALVELSRAYRKLDPDGRLEPAEDHPGYLTTACDSWQVFVPWPLVHVCPSDDVFKDLLQAGYRIACSPVDNLCISGSSAARGAKIEIGDLDFCQYVQAAPAQIVATAQTFKTPAPERVLTRASYGDPVLAFAIAPWPENWSKLESVMLLATTIKDAQRFMVDFLGSTVNFGVIPMSNVVLSSDFMNHYGGAAQASFVYQEAIAVPKGREGPPWSLFDQCQVVRYLEFLRKQIEQHRKCKPVKAVKRALSLALTMRLWPLDREALRILESPACAAYVRASRTKELERLKQSGDAETRAMALKQLNDFPSNGGDDEAAALRDLPQECERFIDEFMQALADLDGRA
jgi:hypothetical protein